MNQYQDVSIFPFTTIMANGYIPPSVSTPMAITKQLLYFRYKCVQLMLRNGQHYWKPAMKDPKAQNTRQKLNHSE